MREAARLFLGVFAVAFVLRLPFLDAGYGWDSDAWRVASAAAAMAETGSYAAPRLPGNPVHDIAMAVLWALGPWARSPRVLNGASALVSSLGAGAFAFAWLRRGPGSAGTGALAGLAAASVPAVFVASVSTLDYAWGFAFVAGALAAASHGRTTLAGALGALAVGTRLTGVLALVGVALVLFAPHRPLRRAAARMLGFVALWTLIGLLPYLPLWIERGAAAITWYDIGTPSFPVLLKKATVDLWGWPAFLAWLAVVGSAMGAALVRRSGRNGAKAPDDVWPSRATVGAAAAAWLRLPYKATYLVPMVPFVLRAHATLRPVALRGLLAALVVSPWLVSVYAPRPGDRSARSAWAREVQVAGQAFVVDARGPILLDHAARRRDLAYGERIAAAARGLPPGSALIVQDWLPMLRLVLGRVRGPVEKDGVLYTHLLDQAEVERLRKDGRALYYLPGVEVANRDFFGVDLVAAGARPLVP